MIWLSHDNIITSLGTDTIQNLKAISENRTGILQHTAFSKHTKAPLSLVDYAPIKNSISSIFPNHEFTRFESLILFSLHETLEQSGIKPDNSRTLLILSSTKGNIELLETGKKVPEHAFLYTSAEKIAKLFGFTNKPLVVCNACISGVLAISLAKRYINSGKYDQVIVTGADVVTNFVVAGFESFKSMSKNPCRPFDKARDGLSLGEGAGTIVITNQRTTEKISLEGGASANDANHISGPSRTGEGLFQAATKALEGNRKVDLISAHGTATPYNDDMESHAISRLGLKDVPVNSFKGYFGHTLGAAGIIETILTKHSMLNNYIFPSLGLINKGIAQDINVINAPIEREINTALKLASGFGGCNAAIVLKKHE